MAKLEQMSQKMASIETTHQAEVQSLKAKLEGVRPASQATA